MYHATQRNGAVSAGWVPGFGAEVLGLLARAIALLLLLLITPDHQARAAIHQLTSPLELGDHTTLTFEGYPGNAVANTLFEDQGITFSRDDGAAVFVQDWGALGRSTTSVPNVLATILVSPVNSTYVTHLNITSATPLTALGAYFGNDQGSDFSSIRVSVFGMSGEPLGFVDVPTNDNTSVDQFIGIRSDVPFSQVRLENLSESGPPSQYLSVVLDDVVFSTVPEPPLVPVEIDVKPHRRTNRLHARSRAAIPVAILGSETFDVESVDPATVRLGPEAALAVGRAKVRDVNHDGWDDLVLRFRQRQMGVAFGDMEVCLSGLAFEDVEFEGCDAISVVR